MTENLHGHPGMDIERDQERGASTPGVMHTNARNSRDAASDHELADEVPWVVWGAMPRSEDETGFHPAASRAGTIVRLAPGTQPKCGDADAWQRQHGYRRCGLGLAKAQFTAYALELPPDVDLLSLGVHVLPAAPVFRPERLVREHRLRPKRVSERGQTDPELLRLARAAAPGHIRGT